MTDTGPEKSIGSSEGKEEAAEIPELDKYAAIITADDVLWEMTKSAKSGWSNISKEQQKELLSHFEAIIDSSHHYYSVYQQLNKMVSSPHDKYSEGTADGKKELIGRLDSGRRAAHNAVIDSLNIMSRRMKEFGLNNSWRGDDRIYTPDSSSDGSGEGTRKKIAQWVFHLHDIEVGLEREAE